MKQCLYRALCSFLSEAPVFPHSSDSGMSRWVGTCRQSTLTDPHSGWGGGATLPHFTVSIRVLGLGAGLRCQLHPCLGVAREPRRRSAARTLCGHPRDALPAGSYAFPAQALRSNTARGIQAAAWGIYHLLPSTASATSNFSASICGAESQWQGPWTRRRYHLAA